MEKLERAKALALAAHFGMVDKNHMPYWHHLASVAYMAGVHGEEYAITGWLHDIVEDTEVTLMEIRDEFGDAIADAIDAMTKRKIDGVKEDYWEYMERVKGNDIARVVKAADLAHNTDTTRGAVPGHLGKKYGKAIKYLEAA